MALNLWAARIERALSEEEEQAMLRLLPPGRRERLERVKDRERWREPLCAYTILRMALWEQYRWRDFPEVTLSSFGKPGFADFPTVHFNLSHTTGAVLVAVADAPVGVDIEKIRPVSQRSMRRIADVTSERAFFQSWVRREARAKRGGAGIGTMLESDTPLNNGEYFYFLDTFDGYVAGAATRSAEAPGAIRRFSLDEIL